MSNKTTEEAAALKVGDKVYFEYWDSDDCKDIYGRGKVTEVDEHNNTIHVQTTRKLHWMEPTAAHLLTPKPPKTNG